MVHLKHGIILLLIVVLYIFLGITISYGRHPEVSEAYKESFQTDAFYSDTLSCDRACVIEDNTEALDERLRMIHQAEHTIILSTFDFRADHSGKDIIAALYQASMRGVDIKILVDGFSAFTNMDGNEYFCALAKQKNVEIRIYNRINLFMPWKTMGRMHDKYLIADGNIYVLGGRNTYDYFLGDNGYKNYDRDLLVYNTQPDNPNSSVHQIETYFESVWNMKVCKDFMKHPRNIWKNTDKAEKALEKRYNKIIRKNPALSEKADYEKITYEVNQIRLLSNPTHVYAKEPAVFYSLTELMKTTDKAIDIHTPYIICNDWMYQSLQDLCKKNKNVRLMTNSVANNGNPFGASDYQINKDKILETGISIYEYDGGVSYHGKSITIGDELSVIGSFNMDMRSAYLDTEMMLVVDSEQINRQLGTYMQKYEKSSVQALPNGQYHIPSDVTRQKLSQKKETRINIVKWVNWLRFLM